MSVGGRVAEWACSGWGVGVVEVCVHGGGGQGVYIGGGVYMYN